ncbi:MAG: EAL domain-containing protein [Eubacterium sp.]|nr:EAL domain-containing protein [Eubacterium sp.]
MRNRKNLKRGIIILLFLTFIITAAVPFISSAHHHEPKVVRVGWYESAFHTTDRFGRRSGYGYEYQQRISTYTGWTYEYVEGSWSELFEMLQNGEIDLLSDVSYTEERAQKILYSADAIGQESYYTFISPDNREIKPDDLSTFNGKKVGVNKNSIQEKLYIEWAEKNDIQSEVIELTAKSPELIRMLTDGEIDILVTLDTYGNSYDIVPVCKIGFAESFFGINKNRPDLKHELDAAMIRLFEENRDFNQKLADKYNKSASVTRFLTPEEKEWLEEHGTIRIGYRNGYLPFCDTNNNSGALTGALSDFIYHAESSGISEDLKFEAIPYESTDTALNDLAEGKIDCVFPVALSTYDGESMGIVITDPFVSTEMYAAVRTDERKGVSPDMNLKVSYVPGNPNMMTFLKDHFPNWTQVPYESLEEAFRSVSTEDTDCVLLSSYRLNYVSDLCEKYKLSTLATGEEMELSFATRKQDDCLYTILNKLNRHIPSTTLNMALTKYAFRDTKVTFGDYVKDNLVYVIAAIAIVAVVILLLQLRNVRSKAKAEEGRQIISEAERDPLTNLYNWNFFLIYANRLYHEHPKTPMDAIVMNIDRFHSINALHGREFGDRVLKELGEEIRDFLSETEGIASRFEADRFDIYCKHEDDLEEKLKRFQMRLDAMSGNATLHLRMGIKPWQEGMEPVQQFDCARTACNMMRGDYKKHIMVYDAAMGNREERDQLLLNDFGRALEERDFKVYYQPKYDIRPDTPILASAEALVRWEHPLLGTISPAIFIPLFEQSGLISPLDKYVWAEAGRQIAAWRDQYGITLPISVNLSRVDVFDPNLYDILDEIIKQNKLKHQDLLLEITESAYTENAEQLIRVIEKLRGKGYHIEMDDFGSGYSSLNMLSTMPIDALKMDIEFIRNIERDEKDLRLVELIVDIARYLNVPVIAEGVETEAQLKLLRGSGCDLVQGYYFSRPLKPEDFERNLLNHLNDKRN